MRAARLGKSNALQRRCTTIREHEHESKLLDKSSFSEFMIGKTLHLAWYPLVLASLAGFADLEVLAAETITTIGITEPILDSIVGTPVSGIVAARKFKEGDFVKKGDIIVELDKALEDLEVARREVVLEPLKTDYEATKYLLELPKTSVSKEILDKKQSDYRVALAEYELAKEQARKRLILAPFDGYITEFFHQVGEACQVEQPPIVRLVDTSRCFFICNLDAKVGHGLRVGQKVELEIESGPSVVLLSGNISFASPVVDAASGLMKVKVIFENPEGKIKPGVAGKMMFEEAANVSARK
jgi:RND family efflux transporter MFP subunit